MSENQIFFQGFQGIKKWNIGLKWVMAMVVLILVYWFSGGIKLEHWPKMG